MRKHPSIYEINTAVYLQKLSRRYNRPLTLFSVPDNEWEGLKKLGFDCIWLMGVWQRSPRSRRLALADSGLREEFSRVLPGWTETDVSGSPYAVAGYELDPRFGRKGDLAEVKAKLNRIGLKLILDFVPNHLACDHPWTSSNPERFVCAPDVIPAAHPEWFFKTREGRYLAHGRDPYFPPWTDTVQINHFSVEMRKAMTAELLKIAEMADGVRCDMAMLCLNRIFQSIWKEFITEKTPQKEFWTEAIQTLKAAHPGFVFLGEVYWNLEWELQGLGFDFTYDKTLYDRLRYARAADVMAHLRADSVFQERSARFIENHDEGRAISVFGREASMAAGLAMCTLPGMRLVHQGQINGFSLKLPVQLARGPEEEPDKALRHFYDRILEISGEELFHSGRWRLCEPVDLSSDCAQSSDLLAWQWNDGKKLSIVIVNYTGRQSKVRIKAALPERSERFLKFQDRLTGAIYFYDIQEILPKGIFVNMPPWGCHILEHQISKA